MIFLLLVAVGVTIWLQYKTRVELRRDRERAERLEELSQRRCVEIYDAWVHTRYNEFIEDFAKTRGFDYMKVVDAMPKLGEMTLDDIPWSPWDTPNDFISRGKAGEIYWESHPDSGLVKDAIKKIDGANPQDFMRRDPLGQKLSEQDQ
jgi:hypothetical protein